MDAQAMQQVLGAICFGELRAHRGAAQRAAETADEDERRQWSVIAAQELRHYEGFRARLAALGADPERAMETFRPAFEAYDAREPGDAIEAAVWGLLGEGVADDLMEWFGQVVDPEFAAFVATVLDDERQHEDQAARQVRAVIGDDPAQRAQALAAAQSMIDAMLAGGAAGAPSPGGVGLPPDSPFLAFLRIGRADALVRGILGGFARRLVAIGVDPRALRTPFTQRN